MFNFALLVGIYSYIIFTLGIAGLLYKNVVIWSTLGFWLIFIYKFRKKISGWAIKQKSSWLITKNKLLIFLIIIFVLQAITNLIGSLGPELAFDALWYHLTLPKIYLDNHSVFFIPGGLLYYSAMPKLGEMLFIAGLSFGSEIWVKVIHFAFGLLASLALYKFQRKFYNPFISMIGVLIFYSNLIVAWESITAYIDLIRTFFEILALWAFTNWWQNNERKWFITSAIMVGLATTTKLLGIGSILIFSIIMIFKGTNKLLHNSKKSYILYTIYNKFAYLFIYWLIALSMSLPWFIFSYSNTGNPVYPFFSEIYKITPATFSALDLISQIWILFTYSPDPISPVYIIFLPLIIFSFSKSRTEIKIISLYSLLSVILWYFIPRTGGGRFILPYLPAMSIICAGYLNQILKNKKNNDLFLTKYLIILIITVTLTSIGYRFFANIKYVPVIFGKDTKQKFLTNHLNFAFGDFYDTDNFFKNNIKKTDRVLLFGFHNLYYIDFPYIDSSLLKKDYKFNYIATQNMNIPKEYKNWRLIYTNPKTMVKLYWNP